jgi:ubiquinol-cytochrome c reductase cytochrome c subunit
MKHFRTAFTHPATLALALFLAAGSAQAQSAEKGKVAYIQNGCWQCHGFEGQGGVAGLPLAPNVKPLAYITAFVRNTRGPMPPYSEKILSNAELADIHAYLQSRPAAPDLKTIPLLN